MEELLEKIRKEGEAFCDNLKKVRSVTCVDGYFGAFLGSNSIQEARKVAKNSKQDKKKIISVLRESISELYKTCASWNHSLTKPYGYPGDFFILEIIYDGIPHPDTTNPSAMQVDLWGQSTILPRAVNARKNALRVFIEEFTKDYSRENRANILSIASGSAREIRELPKQVIERTKVVLLDQDERALNFALGIFNSRPANISVTPVVDDALKNMADNPELTSNNFFNLIYSFGLYDYLPDKYVIRNMSQSLPYLEDKGIFVFALKDERFYPKWFYDWFYDWRFFGRRIDDGFMLAKKAGMIVKNTIIVESGTIVLFICKKIT